MNKTLLLFLDAVRFKDLNPHNAPFLSKLAQAGVYGPLRTLPGYHVEYSIMSGWNPLKHNIWSWIYLNPDESPYKWVNYFKAIFLPLDKTKIRKVLRKFTTYVSCVIRILKGHSRMLDIKELPIGKMMKFGISVDKSYIDQGAMNVPTLFDILKKNGVNYFASEFPTKSTPKGVSYQIMGKSDVSKLNQLKRKARQGYDFLYAHMWQLDTVQHNYGPGSPEALQYLRKLDAEVESLVRSLQNEEKWNVIVFSDHGFVKVEGALDVIGTLAGLGLKEEADYTILPDSTMARIWFNNPNDINRVKEAFAAKPCRVFDQKNIGELFIPYNRPYTGDLLVFADLGYQISPNYFQGDDVAKGMHGYYHHAEDINGIFILNSIDIKEPHRFDGADLVDVLPSVLELLGIETGLTFGGISKLNSNEREKAFSN